MSILKNGILFLFLLLVISVLGNIFISASDLFFNYDILSIKGYATSKPSIYIKMIFVVKVIALLIFIYSVFKLISNINLLTKGDFFNPQLISGFAKSGKLFLISGCIGFSASIISMFVFVIFEDFGGQNYINIDSKSLYIMLMVLGLFFLIFSKVLRKASLIKNENDLTI